jgi:hypothetical protein
MKNTHSLRVQGLKPYKDTPDTTIHYMEAQIILRTFCHLRSLAVSKARRGRENYLLTSIHDRQESSLGSMHADKRNGHPFSKARAAPEDAM